jgi:hypothetical protein
MRFSVMSTLGRLQRTIAMADPRNDEKFDKGKEKRGIGKTIEPGTGSAPPRSMGTHGSEFGQFGDATGPAGQQGQSGTGQADLGSQAATTLAGRSDQQDLGIDQPGRVAGAGGSTGEGFIGAEGAGSDDYLQEPESAASAQANKGTDFAPQGRGATEDEDDSEGHPS